MVADATHLLGDRVIVIGGSLAGMLAVRAVAPHFREVTVLERDDLSGPVGPRKLAPQSYHLHVLLKGGENAMERLAPGFRAAIEEVKVDFAYASTFVRLAPDPERDWKGLVVGNLPRVGARGAVIMPIEGGLHVCSVGGRAGDYPPEDREGFIDFVRALPHPAMAATLERAEFVRPIVPPPARRRRHRLWAG